MGERWCQPRLVSASWLLGVLFIVFAVESASAARGGHCPSLNQWGVCPSPLRPCSADEVCRGREKCCMSPCGPACVSPLFTGCEQLRSESLRRARALGGRHHVRVPTCDEKGAFQKIQCEFNDLETEDTPCWCVDAAGFEIPATRAPSMREVNCSNPRPCGGHTCRMLCPYGFELNPEDGCPICQCHDPCAGISCPGSLECQLEESACLSQPCPPIPTCKRARSLDNICPLGPPLKVDGERPFLCGTTPGKPQCPPLFQCLVQSGHDYGVCCSSSMQLEKQGACPAEEEEEGELYREEESELDSEGRSLCEGSLCEYDLHCPNGLKCCGRGKACGKRCTAPQNVTICLQQRMLAQLLSSEAERENRKGYVPQCSLSTGNFLRRQCSRNRLICWCVDPITGVKAHGSMGPAQNVKCDPVSPKPVSPSNELGSARSGARSLCDTHVCAQLCEFGFKAIPGDGCPSCECEDNPCSDFKCEADEECVTQQAVPNCPVGDPLCGSVRPICQKKKVSDEEASPEIRISTKENKNELEDVNEPEIAENSHETPQDDLENRQTPTMCEYLRDFSSQMEASKDGMSLAVPVPSCNLTDGMYNAMQCEIRFGEKQCWCVDEFGTEIPRTRGDGIAKEDCVQLRESLDCLGLTCRLGCDFGFVLDDGDELGRTEEERLGTRCPKCECRDPCLGASLPGGRCGPEFDCLLAEVECQPGDYCPPVPSCVRKKPGQCPYLVPPGTGSCEYECRTDQHCNSSAKCCSNGCGTQCVQPLFLSACQHQRAVMEQRARESGIPARRVFLPECLEGGGFAPVQCHPLTKECWCVNVGGMEIPGTKTTNGVRPKCPGGPFMPAKQTEESQPDTSVLEPEGNSQVEFIGNNGHRECPKYKCTENCPHGRLPDSRGCPTCTCYDPCEQSVEGKGKVKCSEGEECRAIKVQCVDEPCPPVALCLPKASNPCVSSGGHPLLLVVPPAVTNASSSRPVTCGPEGDTCPSTHKCHLSPFGEYAVCCPKTKDSCLEPADPGRECYQAPSKRWYFNTNAKRCVQFSFEGCGGNLNNFETEEACRLVCPAPTKCERARLRSEQLAQRLSKLTATHTAAGIAATFVPRCVEGSGAWEPVQCLEGATTPLCWCVDPISGTPVKGTISKRKLEHAECVKQPQAPNNVARRRSGKARNFESEWFELEEESAQPVDQILEESSFEVREVVINTTPSPSEEVTTLPPEVEPESELPLTRCQAMKKNVEELSAGQGTLSVVCDREGRFLPMQCYHPMQGASGETYQECWCVDEAGNQLPNTTTFKRGTKICLPTPIEAVEIHLGFQGSHVGMKKKAVIGSVRDILSKMGAKVKADSIEVEMRPSDADGDSIHVQFSLIGPNKVDVAYQLEQMVKAKQVVVEVEKSSSKDKEMGNPERKDEGHRKMVAEITSSFFSHRPVSSIGQRVIALEHREILLSDNADESSAKESPLFGSRSLNGGGSSSGAAALLGVCVISSFIICILSVLLMIQKGRSKNGRWFTGGDTSKKCEVMGEMEDGGSYYKTCDVVPTSPSTPAPIFVLTPECLKEDVNSISNSENALVK
ncbi:uncharacterized protein LOC124167922 [Ischnura elegans]|uniref:uncharacterized protein LOC124167922 n=1 Tax=Ischnura elegans TaxID=197161 RepID=UPI001ED8A861|nr:uncharacterized protein LOC124167922 [Ischnura elegans]